MSNKRIFASARDDAGFYDGSTVDAEGCVWNAMVIGGELIRYTPDGEVQRRIGMPVKNVTSLCFAGEQLDEIYVTSCVASACLTAAENRSTSSLVVSKDVTQRATASLSRQV